MFNGALRGLQGKHPNYSPFLCQREAVAYILVDGFRDNVYSILQIIHFSGKLKYWTHAKYFSGADNYFKLPYSSPSLIKLYCRPEFGASVLHQIT